MTMAASGKSKKKMSLNRRNTLVGLSFILPNFIGFFYLCYDTGGLFADAQFCRLGRFQPYEVCRT